MDKVKEKLNQMSSHDANIAQIRLDRKSTIRQAKTIREREIVSLSAKISESQDIFHNMNTALVENLPLKRALTHIYRAKQL